MAADRGPILSAWWNAKWARLTLATRGDVERYQARHWLDRASVAVVRKTPAVAALAGKRLADFPIVTPAQIRADFARWNTLGLSREQAEAAARDAETGGPGEAAPGIAAGFSTGASGVRGVFLSSADERARYIGQTLARLLPAWGLLTPHRVALVLRADNRLYHAVEDAGPFKFQFFGLDLAPGERAEALKAFDPDVLIAPADVLADLARRAEADGYRLPGLRRLFWGAEPMGAGEREWIAEALGVHPDPIYQATEGFLGAACPEGVLHLNEDSLVVELEAVEGTPAFRPIVTDLFRTSQPIIRVRLDDLIEPTGSKCACGSAFRAIRPVEGRIGDLWRWDEQIVRPAQVWAAMEAALGPRADWRAVGSGKGVGVQVGRVADGKAAVAALKALVGERPVKLVAGPPVPDGPKRRRVRWEG